MRSLLIAPLVLAFGLMFSGFPANAKGTHSHKVKIENIQFPKSLTIKAGDTIVWTNADIVPHTVTAKDNSFDSGKIDPGHWWSHRFHKKGKFDYYCKFHPSMLGKLIVH